MTDPGAIIGGFHLLGLLFPSRPLSELTTESYEQLCDRYKRRDFWGNGIALVAYVALVAMFSAVLIASAELVTHGVPREHYLGPSNVLLVVFAFFLALVSTGFVVFTGLRLVIGEEDYAVYMAYGGEKLRRSGIGVALDPSKVHSLFFFFLGPPLVLTAAAYIDNYTSFTPEKMIFNSFWSLGTTTTRPYSDVAGVYDVQKVHLRFEDKTEPHQVIRFVDGTRWETERGKGGSILEHQRELITFVATQSGKPVQVVEFDDNIPQ